MLLLSLILISLLGTALAFSLVELGMVAYGVHYYDQSETIEYYCGYLETCNETIHGHVPDVVSFLMFCAVWSVLATAVAIWLPLWFHRRDAHHHNRWLAPGLIAVYFVTWVFWLAGFADLANIIGTAGTGIIAAILAFAILNWIVYMALFIFSFLAIFDVMTGEWPGYLVMRSRSATDAPAAPAAYTGAPAEPKYETNHELTA
ncbi:hypothetical protein UA08_02735 [Talaromyces atroroseus]|uniref:MARVEL domain-containing protein n=1 Tax=Talaromyces atroroseus TaxID=1441469 RepID=A0A225ALW4_TALAT|nr:hypothetical protein UA08_02735 [Talaromyces atroroseus]OKL62542.1 hypothetical protein UA08_02735 [Talaromyces atroroseus]